MPQLDDEHHKNNKGGEKLQRRRARSVRSEQTFLVRLGEISNPLVGGSNGGFGACVS